MQSFSYKKLCFHLSYIDNMKEKFSIDYAISIQTVNEKIFYLDIMPRGRMEKNDECDFREN